LIDAIGPGFAVVEQLWNTTGFPWLPHRWIARRPFHFRPHRDDPDRLMFDDYSDEGLGLETPVGKWIVHKPELTPGNMAGSGLTRVVAPALLVKAWAMRDWLAFSETYGQPIRLGTHPAQADPKDVATLRRAIAELGTNAGAVFPDTMKISLERASMSGNAGSDRFFLELHEASIRSINKAVLGQDQKADEGRAARAQNFVRGQISETFRDADAQGLEACFQEYVLKPVIDLNWGRPSDGRYPAMKLDTFPAYDQLVFSQAIGPLIDRGLEVSAADVRRVFALRPPEEGEDTLKPAKSLEPASRPGTPPGGPAAGAPE
jgi:phage gp29-like protein